MTIVTGFIVCATVEGIDGWQAATVESEKTSRRAEPSVKAAVACLVPVEEGGQAHESTVFDTLLLSAGTNVRNSDGGLQAFKEDDGAVVGLERSYLSCLA